VRDEAAFPADAHDSLTATPPASQVSASARSPRDKRLDVFRGLCLVMIFINHVPGNTYEAFTSRNFGFSDAAEAFVIMSGVACGLAYCTDFAAPMRLWQGLARVWGRSWTLYMVQMLVTLAALAIAAGTAKVTGDARILYENNMDWLWHHPVETLIGLPLLLHQFAYLDILPLYILLLAASPLFLLVAQRAPAVLLAGSLVVWAWCGIARATLYTWPMGGGWQFNPLAWQAVFVIGLLIGVQAKQGKRLVPARCLYLALACGYLLFSLMVTRWQAFADLFGAGMWALKDSLGVPWIFTDFDKPFVTAPRVLHIVALTYVLASVPVLTRLCASRSAAPLAVLGRQSLAVFALGSVLAIGMQGLFHTIDRDPWVEAGLLGGGLALQFALAYARESWPKTARR
jgi:hypothetical protein